MPVHLLNELVKQTPEGVYLTSVKQDGQSAGRHRRCADQERVSEFLRNTAYNSEWLVKPELVESKAATVQAANREQKRLFDFSVRLTSSVRQAAGAAAAGSGRRRRRRRAASGGRQPSTRRQEGLRPWRPRRKIRQRRSELRLRRRGVAVPRPEPERAGPVADAAEGRWPGAASR